MNIFIDVGHPAHVHYFKNVVWMLQKKGHKFLFSARNRGEIFNLLESYGFDYVDRGAGADGQISKMMYLPKADFLLWRLARKFKPDLFLSFGSMYAAHASKLLGVPHITFDDTEFSKKEYYLYAPFTEVICTPECFRRELGRKQIRFRGMMELCYLHPNYYEPDAEIRALLGLAGDERYVIMRFVAFKAIHDSGVVGFDKKRKIRLVKELSKYAKVFISSENGLPDELAPYKVKIPPKKLHDVIAHAALYVGDSQTTTTEAACLGTPAVRCNTFAKSEFERANFIELEDKYQLLRNFNVRDVDSAIDAAIEMVQEDALKAEWQKKRERFLNDKIDVSAFMGWLVEDYPNSVARMKENPEYQETFK